MADRYELELVNHFEIEEQVLFPLCEDRALIDGLLADHRAIEGLVARLRETPSAELLEQFCELLSTHIRREEKDLFERLQASVPKDLLDRAGREIDSRAVRVCL